MSATFGSLGDIVSLCNLIKDLCKALDQSRGLSTEYRAIIAGLWTLDDVLVQAELLCERHESSDELESLATLRFAKNRFWQTAKPIGQSRI